MKVFRTPFSLLMLILSISLPALSLEDGDLEHDAIDANSEFQREMPSQWQEEPEEDTDQIRHSMKMDGGGDELLDNTGHQASKKEEE